MFCRISQVHTFILLLCCVAVSFTSGCASNPYAVFSKDNPTFEETDQAVELPDFTLLPADELVLTCDQFASNTSVEEAKRLICLHELLSRDGLSESEEKYALENHSLSLRRLIQGRNGLGDNVSLNFEQEVDFVLVADIRATSSRLIPTIFGELGVAAITRLPNDQHELEENRPQEGIFETLNLMLSDWKLTQDRKLELFVSITTTNESLEFTLGQNSYRKKYSPSAAYLLLIDSADIDDYSFVGFVNPLNAEKRRGVFSIGPSVSHKTPIIMIHGLNSDPLIWRYLTMQVLNDEELYEKYQIWHVNYPSGPPPFFNAMKIRKDVQKLVTRLQIPKEKNAVFIGHSMGGIIAKTLATDSDFKLWDATFIERPETLVSEEDTEVKDIFIFEPIFDQNRIFFIDTPHRGSEVARSFIGQLGASIVSLPENFTGIFKRFTEKVGIDKLTDQMLPFLRDHGPNSVQVLRPGHPLMMTLLELNIAGESFSIIGSNGEINCSAEITCEQITDGVVTYKSAFIDNSTETIIVESEHDSYANRKAIDFVIQRLANSYY